MGSGHQSQPRPVAQPPLARKGGQFAYRPSGRSAASPPESYVAIQYRAQAISKEEVHGEIPNIVSEVLKEELSYRAQARKFLWEFFD